MDGACTTTAQQSSATLSPVLPLLEQTGKEVTELRETSNRIENKLQQHIDQANTARKAILDACKEEIRTVCKREVRNIAAQAAGGDEGSRQREAPKSLLTELQTASPASTNSREAEDPDRFKSEKEESAGSESGSISESEGDGGENRFDWGAGWRRPSKTP